MGMRGLALLAPMMLVSVAALAGQPCSGTASQAGSAAFATCLSPAGADARAGLSSARAPVTTTTALPTAAPERLPVSFDLPTAVPLAPAAPGLAGATPPATAPIAPLAPGWRLTLPGLQGWPFTAQ